MVPGLLTLKPRSCFLLGTFKSSPTPHYPRGAQMMFVYLQSLQVQHHLHVSQSHEKSERANPYSKVGVEIVGSRFFFLFFFENHRLPSCCSNNKLNFQDLPEALLLSTNTQRGLNLDTYHSPLLFKPCIRRLPKTPDPWITPCFHSNRSGATLFRCVI